jgi:hypothetical protein
MTTAAFFSTQYEEYIFRDRLLSIVHEHDLARPLLLFYTPHVAHMPLQVPQPGASLPLSAGVHLTVLDSSYDRMCLVARAVEMGHFMADPPAAAAGARGVSRAVSAADQGEKDATSSLVHPLFHTEFG